MKAGYGSQRYGRDNSLGGITMAQFSRLETLNAMYEGGLVPVFYNGDIEVAKQIVDAIAAGGGRVAEFTNRGDFAIEVFAELVKYARDTHPNMIMGVGSVIDAPTAAMYIANGANFVVGPTLNAEAAETCNRRKIPYSPGCGSATEIQQAHELGVEIVKLFPGGEVGGPAFVKAVKGPSPWVSIMPTGGVDATEESITAWIQAGAVALGIGSKLVSKDLVAAGDFDAISAKVKDCLWWVKKARGESVFVSIEHPGIYPTEDGGGQEMADWYARTFGFDMKIGNSTIFISGHGKGRLEIAKEPTADKAHVCVLVHDFEQAIAELESRGIEVEEANVKPTLKAAYLKDADPAGHRVHLLWNPEVT